jgi:tetratricopeptide (TPR) repeat protein/predicted aspartyl protease
MRPDAGRPGGRGWALAASFALALALAAPTAHAAAKCRLSKMLEVPVTMQGPRALISAEVNGQDVRFFVDTGAFYSIITPEAAKRLKLTDVPIGSLMVAGVGGEAEVSAGEAKTFSLAHVPLKHVQFIVGGREFSAGTVGLLGENFLYFADVEFDFANGVMRFLKAQDCGGVDIGYWKPGMANVVPIEAVTERDPHIIAKAKVNGRWMRVEFDTGSPVSLISQDAAARAGIRREGQGVEAAGVMGGIGHGVVETWTAPVESFSLGDEEIKNTRLLVGKFGLNDVDMLLGADFFLSHRMLVAHSQNRLYFTYNGGPVFRLDSPPSPSQAVSGEGAAAKADGPPATGDELARRGDALMSRHDYEGAVAAFTQAIQLEPKVAKHHTDRAAARRYLHQPVLAMADYEAALSLDPTNVTALIGRGEMALEREKIADARAYFARALKAAADQPNLQLRLASIWARSGHWDVAIEAYDGWIADHPKADERWDALNGRCWARAMLGQELDKALADCDAAVRHVQSSQYLDSRGLVHLRRGEWRAAIADYDVALRLQPKLAWSLLGRGLAKQKLGDTAGGATDMAAGLALQPGLEAQARRMGLIAPKSAPVKHQDPAEPKG